MNRDRFFKRVLTLILCAALLAAPAVPGFAEETAPAEAGPAEGGPAEAGPVEGGPAEAGPVEGGVVDGQALTEMVESFLSERGIPDERVGIGFYLPATGEEWTYHPDTWFYPASVYKVPLMMILAERVSAEMVDPEEVIAGLPLPKLFSYIITYSNNDYAHAVRKYLGGDEVWREEAKQYAGLPDDYYDPDYMDYCYFSPRYITMVMETLNSDPERFPMVLDCMLVADKQHYFQYPQEMYDYDIAQKYGSYLDMQNTNWNHATAVIYTPHPFILTVMTENVGSSEWVLGQFALKFTNYVQGLEDALTAREQAQKPQETLVPGAAQTEAQTLENTAEQSAPEQRQQAAAPQPEARPQAVTDLEKQNLAARQMILSLAATLSAVLVLGILGALLVKRRRKKKRYESYRRRFEEELRQEALERERLKR